MQKTNFTFHHALKWAVFTLLLLLLAGRVSAQAMACNDLVHVSVDPTPNACQAVVTADMILEGTPVPGHNYQIAITNNYIPVASGTNTVVITNASQWFGLTLTVTITDLTTNNYCWGLMTLEDKLPPVITCSDITVTCTADLGNIPLPTAVDNCDLTPTVTLVNEVINQATLCTSGYATIVRTYVATDDGGYTSAPCNQTIYVTRPNVVDFPNDIAWTCDQYNAFPNITAATALHPYVHDTKLSTPLVIDVNLDPACDDSDAADAPNINSTNVPNGGTGCPGSGLDDADVLQLTGSGVVSNIQGTYCLYQSAHSDAVLQTCGSTFKIIRTWTVINWCTGAVVTTGVGGEDNVQVIKILDEVKPSISRPPFTVGANIPGIHPQPCKSTGFLLPPASVSDNCNLVTVKIFTTVGEAIYAPGGGINGGSIPFPGLPLGTHNVNYQATDACGNQLNLTVPVTVVDNIAPTSICDEFTDVNLATDGKATVFASTFDDGSHDNCCLDHFEVRRMTDPCADGHDDTVFGPSIVFCCNDLGSSTVTVVFRAVDCYGNGGDCMVQVTVNDKLPPTLQTCPQNQRITCDWYALNLETQLAGLSQPAASQYLDQWFGTPVFFDNCSFTLNRTFSINLDQCLEGTLSRTFTATDPSGNNSGSCTQTIFVDQVSDWVVEFPADISVTCGSTVPDFGSPEIFYETCELVAVSHDDQVFTVVPDACFKIARRWTVINWCVVGQNIDQEVVEQPENQLGLPFPLCDLDGDGDCDGRTFRDSWRGTALVPNPFAPTIYRLRPGSSDATSSTNPDTDLDSDPWDGFITYEQVIKVNDLVDPIFTNGCAIPDVCITDNTCAATLNLPTPGITDCSPNVTVTAEIKFGTLWVSGFGPFFNVVPGTYEVRYKALDNCNNQTECLTTVTVKDCKKPTPYCKFGLIIELMVVDPAMVQVWATDFNAGSFDNCPGALKYSFSADVSDISRTFTCDDLGQVNVQLWVTDAAGNQDFCETFVILQANMDQCPGVTPLVANVGGAIANEESEGVENVTVNLSGQSTGSVVTSEAGAYSFTGIPLGNDVTVTPEKDDDPLNGVSTFDLVLISKHILNITPLDSPYKLIAADANKSGTVTTFDLVEVRKLILFINTEFPNNTSWRFVEAGYVFPNPANPWEEQFPEVANINDLPSGVLDAHFVAVKIGDVNGSAVANLAAAGSGDRSASGAFVLAADDRTVQAGEEFLVEFLAKEAVQGWQFTLNFDVAKLEFVEVQPGVAKAENFGFTLLDKGALTASFNGNVSSEKLFGVTFRAKAVSRLSEALSLDSRHTAAEAYGLNGEMLNVELRFNGASGSGFELFQNTPNPFKGETLVGFHLPEAGSATLTISDVSGKMLKTVGREFSKGYNEVKFSSAELPAGVLLYTLETASQTATRKMIIVD